MKEYDKQVLLFMCNKTIDDCKAVIRDLTSLFTIERDEEEDNDNEVYNIAMDILNVQKVIDNIKIMKKRLEIDSN